MTSEMPDLLRRRLLQAMTACAVPRLAMAQPAWPTRPVRVVVPFPAGGGADTVARILFAKVADTVGQPFVIDNRRGGGGTVGAGIVAAAQPDGYTILYDATNFSINRSLYSNLAFDY